MNELTIDEQRVLFAHFKIVTGFTLATSVDAGDVNQGNLHLQLQDDQGEKLELRFSTVRNFELDTGPYAPIRLAGIVIEDMSDRQWPGVALRVHAEHAGTSMSFYCQSAEIVTHLGD